MAPSRNSNERRKNISPVQLEIMVSFMEKNLDFARGKTKRDETDRLWESVSKKLNAVPDGATKDTSKWKKSWYNRKRNVKREVRSLCEDQKLGKKDALKVEGLKDMQYRVLKILGEDALDEEGKTASESDDESGSDASNKSWIVTPCRTRASLKPTGSTGNSANKQEDVSSEHFAAYIADRLSRIKSEKKRKNLEDEIIDLVRNCTLND